jgi:hypothetical protein
MLVTVRGRRSVWLAAAVALILPACSWHTSTPTTAPAATTTAPDPAAATTRSPAAASGPLTGAELVWLEGIRKLHTRMDAVLTDLPAIVTDGTLRGAGKKLATCGAQLGRLGPVSARLRPVGVLAGNGCARYEAAAACFATGRGCGFDQTSTASGLFAEAEIKGENIKQAAG